MTGVFVRVERDGHWQNIEFENLTDEEMDEFINRSRLKGQDGWSWAKCFAKWIRENVLSLGEEEP